MMDQVGTGGDSALRFEDEESVGKKEAAVTISVGTPGPTLFLRWIEFLPPLPLPPLITLFKLP
jgi:hypothetical protein